jgi:hypothetical protein
MTEEELLAKIADLESKASGVESANARIAELEAKVSPPVPDPDETYRPKTWKELDERESRKAEEAALKVLENARKKEEEEKKRQDELVAEQDRKIQDAFKKLEEEGVIEPTKDVSDRGGWQRKQILGSLVRSGGQHVEIEARKLRTAWDAGLEYDHERNEFRRQGSAPSAAREQFVASSAGRVSSPPPGGPVSPLGARGDLDEMQARWEASHGKA